VAGSCEHGNELTVSIKGEEFLDHLKVYKFLKKDSFDGFGCSVLATSG
jgi:hypothetical protein